MIRKEIVKAMLNSIEKNLNELIKKTNNNEIEILANCLLALNDIVKNLKGE